MTELRAGVTASMKAIETQIGYQFQNVALLKEALTHRSAVHEQRLAQNKRRERGARGSGSNERLEFMGDRVLGLVMAEWLLERFPAEQEGALGQRHAALVSKNVLAQVAADVGVSAALNISVHEEETGVRQTANVLADALEALLGAIYLDGGLEPVRRLVRQMWHDIMTAQVDPPKDPKTALQEWVLARGLPLPSYEVISAEGPSHAPVFVMGVSAAGQTAQGRAGNKRDAERLAAVNLLKKLA